MLDRQKRTTNVDSVFWQEWQKHQNYLYHCCLKWMEGNSTEAEDALSIAMLKAREKIGKNVQPINSFKAWLTTLTHNLCMDILKDHNHCIVGFEDIDAMCCSANILLVEGVSQGENPVLAAQEQELENFFCLAIDDLPGRLQETFKLYFQEEHSYQQIATELHISCPNVRKRISQARAILHKRLEEYEGTSEKTVFESGKKEKSEPEELPEEIVVAEASQEEVLPGIEEEIVVAEASQEEVLLGVENESILPETMVEEQLPEIENVASGLQLSVISTRVSRLKLWVSLNTPEDLSPDPSPIRRGGSISPRSPPFQRKNVGWVEEPKPNTICLGLTRNRVCGRAMLGKM